MERGIRRGRGHAIDMVDDVGDAVAAGDPAAEAVAFEDDDPGGRLTGVRWPL